MKKFCIFILLWLYSTVLFGQTGQHLPYPVIFIHGLNSDNTAWNKMKTHLLDYGWSYGGNMDFNLNYDGHNSTSLLTEDFHDFENQIVAADFYTINFNVDLNGNFGTGSNLSNQCAIAKQGYAVGNAIRHVMAVTGRDKVILVGHSMGGLAAREYLQNSRNWQNDGKHHVAKLCTVGTPHGGSNADATSLGDIAITFAKGIDFQSEAVRDLRTKYFYSRQPGVFLFGGKESILIMLDQSGSYFYNVDVNCNGEPGDDITGLNKKDLPDDISYSCIYGSTYNVLGLSTSGDGVVSEQSGNLNDNIPGVNADAFPVFNVFHTDLTSLSNEIMQGMDEPGVFQHAYNIELGDLYDGLLTIPAINGPQNPDIDDYAVILPSNGKLKILVVNIPVSAFTVSVYNSFYQKIYSSNSNSVSDMVAEVPINEAGKYYVVLAGLPTATSWKSPYHFSVIFNPSQYTPNSCSTVLSSPSGTFGDGSGSSNYPNNTNCTWLINPPGASSITLKFNSFNTEASNDIVKIYDGNDNTYPSKGTYSGSSLPPYIVSSGGSLFVEFITNGTVTASGWDASYNSSVNNITVHVPGKINGYRYWFDSDINNGSTVSLSIVKQTEVDKLIESNSPMQRGFHTLSFMAKQTDDTWSSPISSLFYYCKNSEQAVYEYWFDSLYENKQTVNIADTTDFTLTNEMLNASALKNGFHQFNIRYKPNGGTWTTVQSEIIFKNGNALIADKHLSLLEYWFDNYYQNSKQVVTNDTVTVVLSNQMLDASQLGNGFHQVNYRLRSNDSLWSSVQSELIYKQQNATISSFEYWFDNNYYAKQVVQVPETDNLVLNEQLLDASSLTNGFHQLNIAFLSTGIKVPSTIQSEIIFKRGNDISAVMDVTKIRYWFNGNFATANELTVTGQNGIIDNIIECNTAPVGKNYIYYQTMDNGNIWSSIIVDSFINAKCSPPPTPTITTQNATTFCQGAFATLVSSNTSGNQWYLDGFPISGATNSTYPAATSGVYTVVTTVNSCSSAASSPVTITVNPLPATPVISWDNTQLSTAVGMATYQWYLNGNLITGANSNVYSPVSSGFYKVEVGNSSGCKAMSAGYNLVFTAVSDVTVNGILYSLYPNPATKEATLKLSSMPLSKTTVTLFNSYGQKVLSRIITNQTETIAVDHLPQGYYLIKIESKNHSGILKLIVLR